MSEIEENNVNDAFWRSVSCMVLSLRRKIYFSSLRGIAALIVGVFVFNALPVFAASFDGTWKVSRTGIGCTPTGLISIQISHGNITGSYMGGSGKHVISGAMSSSGSFNFTARSPRDRVIFSGAVSGDSGRGQWNVKGRSCGGALRIYK